MANLVSAAIDGLEARIALIKTADGYNYTLGNSAPFTHPKDPSTIGGDNPHVYIVDYGSDTERFATNKLFKRISVTLRGITGAQKAGKEEAKDRVLKLQADIEKAVYGDKTLGGAVTTLLLNGDDTTFQEGSNHGVVELDFELHLHYTEGAP